MKRIVLLILFFALPAFGQNIRWDSVAATTGGIGTLVPILAIPGSAVAFYNACTQPCSPTRATTYISATSTTACPTGAQVVWQLPFSQACTSYADSRGEFGGYFQPGAYEYTFTQGGLIYGPYYFTVGGSGGGSGGGPNFNVAITAPQVNKVFYVEGYPATGCTVGGTTYTTQIECAVATASAWVVANSLNATLQGSGLYQNCQAMTLPSVSASLNIVGSTYGVLATGLTIQQSTAPGCNTTQDVLTQPFVSLLNNQEFSKLTIDGNHTVGCVTILGTRHSTYDINCLNPKGDHGIQIGDTNNFPFEIRSPNLEVRTATYGGSFTYPTFTVNLTGGAVSSWTVTNGGSFPSTWPLISYIAPGTQCTTPPSAPTIQLSAPSGGQVTVTGLTTGASAGVGCTVVYVQVFEQPEVNYAVKTSVTDSTFSDIVVAGAAGVAAIQNLHGNNVYIHAHPIGHSPVGVEDHGNNTYVGYEADSIAGYGFQVLGSRTSIHGWKSVWNANVYAGAVDIFLAAGSSSNNVLIDHTCPGFQTAGGYTEFMLPTGPYVPTPGVFPAGMLTLGTNEVCDGSSNDGGNFINTQSMFFGSTNASAYNVFINSSTVPGVNIGDGTNHQNLLWISGGRAQVAYDFNSRALLNGSHGVDLGYGCASLASCPIGFGLTSTGIPFTQVETAIASAATIAPTSGGVVHITGTAAISTMTPPTDCATTGFSCRMTLWPDGAFTIATGGNFLNASNAVVNKPMDCTFDPAQAKWGCSY